LPIIHPRRSYDMPDSWRTPPGEDGRLQYLNAFRNQIAQLDVTDGDRLGSALHQYGRTA